MIQNLLVCYVGRENGGLRRGKKRVVKKRESSWSGKQDILVAHTISAPIACIFSEQPPWVQGASFHDGTAWKLKAA